ncbi:Calcitonin-Related Peptide 2 [Manis pentadactyla]|nr:Calcitonin-Related Peptide 2 [Manis pentadactyla]
MPESHCRCRLCSTAPATCCQRGVMGFWKFSPFLALSLVLYQVGFLQAAPLRAALESRSNAATSSEDESRHLLAALVKDYVRMKAQELGQETEGSSVTAQKRSCNSATCAARTFRPEQLHGSRKKITMDELYFF